jgi:hypothetical protein
VAGAEGVLGVEPLLAALGLLLSAAALGSRWHRQQAAEVPEQGAQHICIHICDPNLQTWVRSRGTGLLTGPFVKWYRRQSRKRHNRVCSIVTSVGLQNRFMVKLVYPIL